MFAKQEPQHSQVSLLLYHPSYAEKGQNQTTEWYWRQKYCRAQNHMLWSPWHSAEKQYTMDNVRPSFHQERNTIAKLQFCQSNEHIKSFLSYFQTFIIKPFLNNPITEVCIFSQLIRPTNLERPPALVYLTGRIPASFQPTGICSQIYSWQTTSLNISSSSTELFNVYL